MIDHKERIRDAQEKLDREILASKISELIVEFNKNIFHEGVVNSIYINNSHTLNPEVDIYWYDSNKSKYPEIYPEFAIEEEIED